MDNFWLYLILYVLVALLSFLLVASFFNNIDRVLSCRATLDCGC